VGAIQQQLFFLEKTGSYNTFFRVIGNIYKNQPQAEIVLYRVVQELLNNIIKHSEATRIEVLMQYREDKMSIIVTDNGKGFHENEIQNSGKRGLGLNNIRNRISMLKGVIAIHSHPGKGTEAIIEISKQPGAP